MKKFVIPLLLFLLSLVLRVTWLDRIPAAISGDELIYILESKSVAVSGRDLTGTWHPLSAFLFRYPPDELQAELGYILNLPAAWVSEFTLFNARITYALLGSLSVLGLYLFVREVFSPGVAAAAGFILAINPWALYIGRSVYEMLPSDLFYIWAMYVMVVRRGKYLLWSLPLYMLAFYSYIATKVILLPIVFLTGWYVYKTFPREFHWRRAAIFTSVIVLFVAFFAYQLTTAEGSRISEVIRLSDPIVAQTVDSLRKSSMKSVFVDAFVNKYTVVGYIVVAKLFKSLSPSFLFAEGDGFFSFYRHGFFYMIDALFVAIGVIALFIASRRKALFIGALVLVSIVPHLLHSANTNDFSAHLTLLFLFLPIFIGYGIYASLMVIRPGLRYATALIIVVLYMLSLGNFLQMYLFSHSVSGQFDFPIRLSSRYISMQEPGRQVYIYTPRTVDMFKKYLFYANIIDRERMPEIRRVLKSDQMKLGPVSFLGCDNKATIPKDVTVLVDRECGPLLVQDDFLKITRWKDGGEDFLIYNDVSCRGFILAPYAQGWTMSSLTVEQLDTKEFCMTFIAQ